MLSRGSVADNNKRHKEAAVAGTGPRFTEIFAHVSSARPNESTARECGATSVAHGISVGLLRAWLCVCACEGAIERSVRRCARILNLSMVVRDCRLPGGSLAAQPAG